MSMKFEIMENVSYIFTWLLRLVPGVRRII